jgi:hypothetical protein
MEHAQSTYIAQMTSTYCTGLPAAGADTKINYALFACQYQISLAVKLVIPVENVNIN